MFSSWVFFHIVLAYCVFHKTFNVACLPTCMWFLLYILLVYNNTALCLGTYVTKVQEMSVPVFSVLGAGQVIVKMLLLCLFFTFVV